MGILQFGDLKACKLNTLLSWFVRKIMSVKQSLRPNVGFRALLAAAVFMILLTTNNVTFAQGLLGQTLEERRAEERAQQQREQKDALIEHAQTWNQSKAEKRARKLSDAKMEEREERLNEISFMYGNLVDELPDKAVLINRPYPSEYSVHGRIKPKYDLDSDIVGGVALKLNVKRASKRVSDQRVTTATIGSINKGDVLCLTFWARAGQSKKKIPNDVVIASLGVRKTIEPFNTILARSADLTQQWQHFSLIFQSTESLDREQANVYFDVGSQKQRLELGPAYLFNLGQVDLAQANGRACKA